MNRFSDRRCSTGASGPLLAGMAIGATLVLPAQAMAADTDASADEKLQEVVVTGSLITDPNRASPSPIVITTIDDLKQSGSVTLEASLNQLPQFAPAGSAGNGGQGT